MIRHESALPGAFFSSFSHFGIPFSGIFPVLGKLFPALSRSPGLFPTRQPLARTLHYQ